MESGDKAPDKVEQQGVDDPDADTEGKHDERQCEKHHQGLQDRVAEAQHHDDHEKGLTGIVADAIDQMGAQDDAEGQH